MQADRNVIDAARREKIQGGEEDQFSMSSSREEYQAPGEQLGITMDQLPVPIETERKTRDDSGNKDQTTVQGSE